MTIPAIATEASSVIPGVPDAPASPWVLQWSSPSARPVRGAPPIVSEARFRRWLARHADRVVGYARDPWACPIFCYFLFGLGRGDIRNVGTGYVAFIGKPSEPARLRDESETNNYARYDPLPWMYVFTDRIDAWAWDTFAAPVEGTICHGKADYNRRFFHPVTGADCLAHGFIDETPTQLARAAVRARHAEYAASHN